MERVEKVANFVFVVGALVCISTLIHSLNHYLWIDEADFTSVLGPILYIALPALMAALLLGALRLRAPFRIKLALVVFSTGVSVCVTEAFLQSTSPFYFGAEPTLWSPNAETNPATVREIVKVARKYGVTFDTRTKGEVIDDLAKKGVLVVPAIGPLMLLKEEADGSLRSAITIDGAEVLPLAGISRKGTVLCNESGEYVVYESGERGFHNPRGIWSISDMDIAAIGDSFTHGMCVPSGKNFVAIVQKRYPRTLNLGMQGTGPLAQLATLKEYLPFVKPKLVFWFYFEGNDLADLRKEMKSWLLRNYLKRDFSQYLFGKQAVLDWTLADYIAKARQNSKLTNKDMVPAGSFRGIIDSTINTAERLSARTTSIFKLPAIREKFGWAYGSRRRQTSVTPAFSRNAEMDMLRDVLLEAKAVVDTWGGKLYFVYLPSRDRYVNPPAVSRNSDYHRGPVLSLVASVGLPLVDIHKVFESRDDLSDLFPFRRFGHYNEKGHRLVAETVVEVICAGVSNDLAISSQRCG